MFGLLVFKGWFGGSLGYLLYKHEGSPHSSQLSFAPRVNTPGTKSLHIANDSAHQG